MYGLSFEERTAAPAVDAPRADIALFVGWCAWRAEAKVGRDLARWFDARLALAVPVGAALPFDRPIPFDAWAQFDAAADWRNRSVSAAGSERADATLGIAVRDFFANGGRRCYVVALGPPWPLTQMLDDAGRAAAFERLLPSFIDRERTRWRGLAHAKALDDVAQVLAPDLPELAAAQRDVVAPSRDAVDPPEVFVECAPRIAPRAGDPGVLRVAVPRCEDADYARWRGFAQRINQFLAQHRRDCCALLALPLPARSARNGRDARQALAGLNGSFLQVAYPWFKQVVPPRTAQGLVAPDGALAGLIASTALSTGAFRTAAGRVPVGVYDVEPLPPPRELQTPEPDLDAGAWAARLSLFAPRLDRIELLSDRTLSERSGWRNASVGRLMGQLLRLARRTGEAFSFEAAGDALFARIRGRFEDLLTQLWQRGALSGARPGEAFTVRCDRTLMTQNDLDNGRVICAIEFAPAYSIERLRVELWLGESGSVGWRETDEIPETVS
jgi:hypothetical protein